MSLEKSYDLTKMQSESNNLHNSLEEDHKMPYNRQIIKDHLNCTIKDPSPVTSILGDSFERESPDFTVNKIKRQREPSKRKQ